MGELHFSCTMYQEGQLRPFCLLVRVLEALGTRGEGIAGMLLGTRIVELRCRLCRRNGPIVSSLSCSLPYGPFACCRLWQAICDSLLLHRKRWIWGGAAAALLLLLIILLATLVPASRNKGDSGPAPPGFLQAPVVSASGASYFDVTVHLDQPAIVSYMLFRSSDLLQQVGERREGYAASQRREPVLTRVQVVSKPSLD